MGRASGHGQLSAGAQALHLALAPSLAPPKANVWSLGLQVLGHSAQLFRGFRQWLQSADLQHIGKARPRLTA